jgi:aspartate carbamoyltransferase regulatory subunit
MLIFSVKKNNYEELIVSMIKRGTVLDHSKSPCEENFIPEKKVSRTSGICTTFKMFL